MLTVGIFKGNKMKSLNFVLLLVFLTAFFFPLDHNITCNVITTEASMVQVRKNEPANAFSQKREQKSGQVGLLSGNPPSQLEK